MVDLASSGFKRDQYWEETRCIDKIATPVEKTRKRGGGCPCHEKELMEGKAVVCTQEGPAAQRGKRQGGGVQDFLP